jgi:hypothetical protein
VARHSPWTFERRNLVDARARFLATGPDERTRNAVSDWLIAAWEDPLRAGEEDPPASGIFFARVATTNVGVLYTIDPKIDRIYVIDIGALDE